MGPGARGRPHRQLADAELLFHDGPLAGLKLTGFAVWSRKDGSQHVTFPTRPYGSNGEKKSFALLRPVPDVAALDTVRTLIVAAYMAQLAAAEPAEYVLRHRGRGAGGLTGRSDRSPAGTRRDQPFDGL